MRTNVIFKHPAAFVPVSPDEGILSVDGADWFVRVLRQIPELQIDPELCQEDWGIVVFAQRSGKRFWIGLSLWPDEAQMWLAHFHHRSFTLQQWTPAGKRELQRLILDAHTALAGEPSVSRIAWHHERDMAKVQEHGSAGPCDV